MIKNIFIIITLCLTFNSSFAQHHAICIPSEKLNTIKIDGVLNEWDWIPENYKLKTNLFLERINCLSPDTNNYAIDIFVAWNELTNRIYIVAKVLDNSIMDGERINIAVNPTNSEGHYWMNGTPAHHNVINYYARFRNDIYLSDLFLGPEWAKSPGFFKWAVEVNRDNSIINYEFSFPIWETWSHKGPDYSKGYILCPNSAIGLLIEFTDMELPPVGKAQWINVFEQNCWFDARSIANRFILDPHISREINWEGIKYVLE